MACHKEPPFTAEQSREIDDRIVEMITAIMGEGQYSSICRSIADRRAAAFAIRAMRADGEWRNAAGRCVAAPAPRASVSPLRRMLAALRASANFGGRSDVL